MLDDFWTPHCHAASKGNSRDAACVLKWTSGTYPESVTTGIVMVEGVRFHLSFLRCVRMIEL